MLGEVLHGIVRAFELTGVTVIVLGFLWALWRAIGYRNAEKAGQRAFNAVRRIFGKSILLGLEILVAADLVRTTALEPTMENLRILAFLIVIRTLLSWSLDVELEGVWPWQKRRLIDDEQLSGIHYDEGV